MRLLPDYFGSVLGHPKVLKLSYDSVIIRVCWLAFLVQVLGGTVAFSTPEPGLPWFGV